MPLKHDQPMTQQLREKVNPERFPNISLHMAAIMGYLRDQTYTVPAIVGLHITSDDCVIGRTSDQIKSFYLGEAADLRANHRRLGMAAGLDDEEWAAYLANRKPGIHIEDPA